MITYTPLLTRSHQWFHVLTLPFEPALHLTAPPTVPGMPQNASNPAQPLLDVDTARWASAQPLPTRILHAAPGATGA